MRVIYSAGSGDELVTVEAVINEFRGKGSLTRYSTDFKIGRVVFRRWPLKITARETGFTLHRSDGRRYEGETVVASPRGAPEIEHDLIRVDFGGKIGRQFLERISVQELIGRLSDMRRYAVETRELYR